MKVKVEFEVDTDNVSDKKQLERILVILEQLKDALNK
mgnify:CR=1 FL=1